MLSTVSLGRFEDLARRFEKPDRRNRWDSPLFELFPSKGTHYFSLLKTISSENFKRAFGIYEQARLKQPLSIKQCWGLLLSCYRHDKYVLV